MALRQTNFLAGELAPSLWGRSDWKYFAAGLRRCLNFFPSRQGPAVSRPGTRMCGTTKFAWGDCRLLPYVYSDTVSFVLEVGNSYIRFWTNGQRVETVPGSPFELTAPWLANDLPELQWAQVGAVLTVTHPKHPPQEVKRDAAGAWSIGPIDFRLPSDTLPAGDTLWRDITNQTGWKWATAPCLVDEPTDALFMPDETHPALDWKWLVTALVTEMATGKSFESRPTLVRTSVWTWEDNVSSLPCDGTTASFPTGYTVGDPSKLRVTLSIVGGLEVLQVRGTDYTVAGNVVIFPVAPPPMYFVRISRPVPTEEPLLPTDKVILSPDRPVRVQRRVDTAHPGFETGFFVTGYNYYRGRGNLYGFVGTSSELEFVDAGTEPDYLTPPPGFTASEPFALTPTALMDTGSVVYDYPAACTFFEERRVFTGGPARPGEVFLSATGDYLNYDVLPLPTSGMALHFELASRKRERIRTLVGLGSLLVFTDTSVWAMDGGGQPLDYDPVGGSFSVNNRVIDEVGGTHLAPIIVDGSVLYVRTKGRGVRELSVLPQSRGGGWAASDASGHAQHLFVGGESFESYGHTRQLTEWTYAEDPWGLIWAIRDDGTLLSATPSGGILGWARHTTQGLWRSVTSVPETREDAVYVVVQRGGTHYVERLESRVLNDSAEDGACVDCAVRFQLPEGEVVLTGLEHLEGLQVNLCAVGSPALGPFTVSDGAIVLPEPMATNYGPEDMRFTIAFVGLPFVAELELLDVVTSDTRTKQKTVTKVGFEVSNSRGLFIGQDFGHLSEWRQRTVANSYGGTGSASELVTVAVSGTWDSHARAVIRQTSSLPVTILGISREIDIGN